MNEELAALLVPFSTKTGALWLEALLACGTNGGVIGGIIAGMKEWSEVRILAYFSCTELTFDT